MTRPIDANALKSAIDNGWKPDMMVSEIWDIIDEVPTIEAEPVRHGHWITKTRHEHYPSGKEYEEDYCSACGMRGSIVYDYCPHCGAFMEEVTE